MKKILFGATAAATLAAATFGAMAQTTITTTTQTVEPQVMFSPEQTTVIRRTITAPPATGSVIYEGDMAVGAVLPETVVLQPVPPTLVTEIPQAQSYQYAVVQNEVVFVDPVTRRVIAVVNQ